jgi:para-aminobenzoate synthetase component 1
VLQQIRHTPSPSGQKPNTEALSKAYEHVCFFDSNKKNNRGQHVEYDALLAIGAIRSFVTSADVPSLEKFQSFCDAKKSWLFGYLSYDLKNETEALHSENADGTGFPLIHFFEPVVVIRFGQEEHILIFDNECLGPEEAEAIYAVAFSPKIIDKTEFTAPGIKSRITKEEYIRSFSEIKKHILRGDIYEINFCQEFYAEQAFISAPAVFEKLNAAGEAPFSAFCRLKEHFILSSSPERFLEKRGNRLISQPIKGTTRRSADKKEDEALKEKLRHDQKEQNENVMIVDLVRNDLSRIAKKGTVHVDELFGIYSFRQVHQMISTVSCGLKENCSFTDILRAAFPMGSMTGAPKVRAMQLIEQYESTKRGVYSGALGYIDPDGNFDFSVVIRSILYNSENHFLSFMTGSAITSKAEAEQEYEECLLKAKAMFGVLS